MSGLNTSGRKKHKTRVTLGLCCSAMGEKLKPVIIGTAANPRCFKGVKLGINSLGVKYYHNRKAWIRQTVFDEWTSSIDKLFRRQNRKVLLFVDNVSSHETPKSLTNVEIKYLPANTTSKLQPLDQGIIRSFKAHYRKHLLNCLLSDLRDLMNGK